ncbi:MAG: CDP-alcohol phosphatidyltransferase family protein [Porticoccaceae bacterium]|nr:CDP-alcohol phosphatidyltransferase family protein [Porticoccaceae bacterium]
MVKNIYSIPNLLSLLRLALVPVLALAATLNQATLFLWLMAISLASDMLDGYFARRLHQVTELGARLDSWADMATYAVMILGLYMIWPSIFIEQVIYLIAATLSYVLPVVIALTRFGSFPSYHTWGAKLAAVLVAPAYYLLILYDNQIFFRMVIIFHVVVALEEIAITFILKQPKTNVASILTILRVRGDKSQ